MNFIGQNNRETWKALVAGQKIAIRDAYLNFQWNYQVPCIITTNNYAMVRHMANSDEFKTQAFFVNCDEYMGPPGTQVQVFSTCKFFMGEKFFQDLEIYSKEIEEKKSCNMGELLAQIKAARDEKDRMRATYDKLLADLRADLANIKEDKNKEMEEIKKLHNATKAESFKKDQTIKSLSLSRKAFKKRAEKYKAIIEDFNPTHSFTPPGSPSHTDNRMEIEKEDQPLILNYFTK